MSTFITDALEKFKEHVDVNLVFGETREVKGKSIIPVATFGYGFGGGTGKGKSGNNDEGSGEGGGGGFKGKPIGVFECKENYTRFIPAVSFKEIILLTFIFLIFLRRLFKK